MEGPIDPQHPGQDAGAPQPEAQDGDLHALLERLLGQGDVRPSAPGAGDDLWPDPFAAPPADEASTIVPAPDVPAAPAALTVADEPFAAAVEPAPARAWEPVVVDTPSTTSVDDIHAAILASVSVELQPMAPAAAPVDPMAAEPAAVVAPGPPAYVEAAYPVDVEPTAPEAFAAAEPSDAFTVDVPAGVFDTEAFPSEFLASEIVPGEDVAADAVAGTVALDLPVLDAAEPVEPVAEEPAGFALTPFEATGPDGADDLHPDAEALWAAAIPELGLDVAPLLDLEAVDIDPADEPGPVKAVVLPWPSHELDPVAPAAPTAHDLIEAALAGLQADLTAEPVEPLRTPDVAVSTAHVVFRLGARTMAIPLAAVSEIARPPKVTRLPHVPAWVMGIANLRGDIVSMLDLEGFLSGKAGKSSHEQRMLALRPSGDEVRTAVLVDGVDGIQAFEDARIARVTRGYDAEVAPYARGLYQLEDDLVVVLDADRLLQSKPMRQFEDGAGAR
jgi:chemotaxis signal transduction protein